MQTLTALLISHCVGLASCISFMPVAALMLAVSTSRLTLCTARVLCTNFQAVPSHFMHHGHAVICGWREAKLFSPADPRGSMYTYETPAGF